MSKSLIVGVGTREYDFTFLVSDARRLKAAGMDLMDPRKYQDLFADVMKQMDLLTEFLKPQLDKQGVSEIQFLDIVVSDAEKYGECLEALTHGLQNFFLNLQQPARAKAIAKSREVVSLAEATRLKKMESPQIDRVIQHKLAESEREIDDEIERLISGEISSIVPESSGLNPGIGPIGN